jgi:prepilin-type N-terminal cleavage/methylation domain-containing protein
MTLPRCGDERGFTLMEVLITMVLLLVISLAIYRATTQTYRLRDILQNEGEFYNGIRLSVGILERDVALIYNPVIMLPKTPKASDPFGAGNGQLTPDEAQELQELQGSDAGRSTTYWSGAVDKTGVRPSRFVGSDTKMTFVSVSHIRIYKDAPESEFLKVKFELVPDRAEGADGAQVLMRTVNPGAFDDNDERLVKSSLSRSTQHVYPLLRGIKKLKYRYLHKTPDKEEWLNAWDSDTQDLKNLYPDMIEVSLEVDGPYRFHFEGTYHFRPEIPLHGLTPTI